MDSKELRLIKEAYASIQEGYGKKEEKEEGCVSKSEKGKHNCAKKVCHESFGEGTCIFGEHAVPDENGFVSHYDVMFEHGVERNVPITEMEVLVLVEHPMEGHRYVGKTISEMDERSPEANAAKQEAAKQKAEQARKSRQTPITAGGGAPEESGQVDKYRQMAIKRQQQNTMRSERQTQTNSADLFDIVKGHLMSEGYADTEEAALAIMANMSEEWRQSILSEDPVQDRRRAEENRSGLRGPELSHASDKTTQPAGGPSKKTQPAGGPSKKTPTPTSPKTPNAGTNKPNSSVSSPGFDTRRIGGYDLRRLP